MKAYPMGRPLSESPISKPTAGWRWAFHTCRHARVPSQSRGAFSGAYFP